MKRPPNACAPRCRARPRCSIAARALCQTTGMTTRRCASRRGRFPVRQTRPFVAQQFRLVIGHEALPVLPAVLDEKRGGNGFGQTLRALADHRNVVGEVPETQLRRMGEAADALEAGQGARLPFEKFEAWPEIGKAQPFVDFPPATRSRQRRMLAAKPAVSRRSRRDRWRSRCRGSPGSASNRPGGGLQPQRRAIRVSAPVSAAPSISRTRGSPAMRSTELRGGAMRCSAMMLQEAQLLASGSAGKPWVKPG